MSQFFRSLLTEVRLMKMKQLASLKRSAVMSTCQQQVADRWKARI